MYFLIGQLCHLSIKLLNRSDFHRFETELAHNGTWQHSHTIAPTIVGNDTRVMWLLYPDGEVPAEPSWANAPYSVHLWIDVVEE